MSSFDIDLAVYRKQRISEKLQLEKQLFPKCIQAPLKYCNNRRSFDGLNKNKENMEQTCLPGQNILNPTTLQMEKSVNYVQEWLNKNERSLQETNLPRKPFNDINVNVQNTAKQMIPNKNKATTRNKAYRKKDKSLQIHSPGDKIKSKLSLKRKEINADMKLEKEVTNCKKIKCVNNESGIFMDNEIVIINDSQDFCNDKDKQACLSILRAENLKPFNNVNSKTCENDYEKVENESNINKSDICKVPFYKKSSLAKMCNQCYENTNKKMVQNTTNNRDVTITIDNNSFVTTINIKHCEGDKSTIRTKHSVDVQTENTFKLESNSDMVSNTTELKPLTDSFKQKNLFLSNNGNDIRKGVVLTNGDEMQNFQVKKSKCVIIDDSDTDSDLFTENDALLEVTAEVHRSESQMDCSVLKQLQQGDYEHRIKHKARGNTPVSTDSSDKENCDPNRTKKQKLGKKNSKKKMISNLF